MKNPDYISNNVKCNSNKKLLAFIVEDILLCNNVNTIMTNANIKTTQHSFKTLFIGFFLIVFYLKNLRPSAKYKKKVIQDIIHHIYNYFIYKLWEYFIKKNRA